MKQNAEATAVMKTIMQRQGVPKPDPVKFDGDASQFPIFKQRMKDWLCEKGFIEKEKVTHLLSLVQGEAKEAIEHCKFEENGYAEAIRILEG